MHKLTVWFIVLIIYSVQPARIMCFFSVPFHSHQTVFRAIIDELLKRGHELVSLTPYPHEKPVENLTEIDVRDISYRMFEEMIQKEHTKNRNTYLANSEISLWTEIIYPINLGIADKQFAHEKMRELLDDDSQQFDLIIIEAILPTSFLAAVKFNAPVIQASSFFGTENNFFTIGASVHPLLLPKFEFQTINDNSLFNRIKYSCLYLTTFLLGQQQITKNENAVIRKHFGTDAPTIAKLEKRVQMFFINLHQIWDNNRPVPRSVVYMGSLQLKDPATLPKDMQNYLDSSKAGVVYVSLGSKFRFSDLPLSTLRTFFKVFETLPYNFLVKWNGGEFPNLPRNVRFEPWLAQNDILQHPNIRAFITQGGLQSTDEAIAAQVPLIAFPILADQFYNGAKYEQHGIGVRMDIDNVDEKILNETIVRVATCQSYRHNLKILARICKEQRAGGLERAMFWIEYVIKHGDASHLRSPLADITFSEYIILDVIIAVSIVIIGSITTFLFVLRVVFLRLQSVFRMVKIMKPY